MKRRSVALLLCVCMLFSCTACQSEQDDIYSQALAGQSGSSLLEPTSSNPFGDIDYDDPDYIGPPSPGPDAQLTPAPDDDLSGELVIKAYTSHQEEQFSYLIQEFTLLHPGVIITFDEEFTLTQWANLSDTERQMSQEGYQAQLRAEISSGEADYLLYDFEEDLDIQGLSQTGALYDMTEFWDNDPDIHEEDYFMSVIEACKMDGKMTVIPYAFHFPGVTFSQRVMEEVGIDLTGVHTVSVTQLLDWYDQARALKPELKLIYTSRDGDTLFPYERQDYIDFAARTCDFDSPEFVEFLQRTKAVCAEDPDLQEDEVGLGYDGLARYWEEYWETGVLPDEIKEYETITDQFSDMVTKAREWFCVPTEQDFISSFTQQRPLEYLTQPYALTSTDGNLGIVTPEAFAMPSSLKNKELAWEFIKYCLSTREEPTFYKLTGFHWIYAVGVPVNIENYRKAVEYVSAGNSFGTFMLGYPGSYKGLDPDATVEDLEAMLSVNTVYAGAYNVDVQEYLDEYYVNDLTSAEKCAKKIQDRTYLWLNE